jgi:hypothetical protein
VFGMLGSGFVLWNSAIADHDPSPAPTMLDPETATEDDLKRMMTMMIDDAKCPACARAMLQGPCGMQLLWLLLCYSKGDDQKNIEACALKYGPALTACMEQHRSYYGLDQGQAPAPEPASSDPDQ